MFHLTMGIFAIIGLLSPGGATSAHNQACVPHIDSISPAGGSIGTEITITGSCFGDGSESTVGLGAQFNSMYTPPTIVSWADASIVARIGAGVLPGQTVTLTVDTPGGTSNQKTFQIYNYTVLQPGSACQVVPGSISIKLFPGAGPVDVVIARHGGHSFSPVFPGNTDSVLSRWWNVQVTPREEVAKVQEFAADADVEYAEPMLSSCRSPDGAPLIELPRMGAGPRSGTPFPVIPLGVGLALAGLAALAVSFRRPA